MKTSVLVLAVLLGACVLVVLQENSASGTNTVQLPEVVITDQNDVVLGPLSATSTGGETTVLMHEPVSGEYFHLKVARNHFGGGDHGDVYFSNANCTGDAYVAAPSLFAALPEIRGSVYAVGPTGSGGASCCTVFRGTGSGANHDLVINSRYRSDAFDGPTCTSNDAGVDTVAATQVLDLSSISFPLKLQ